jgi:hypothetical protein
VHAGHERLDRDHFADHIAADLNGERLREAALG